VTKREHLKETLKLAAPVSFGQLGHILTNVSDTVMLGNYGGEDTLYVAAAGLATNAFFLFLLFALGYSMGITPLIAQHRGAKTMEHIKPLYSSALVSYSVLAVCFSLIMYFGASAISHIGQPEQVVNTAEPYFLILSYSLFPMMFFQLNKQFAEGFEMTLWAMIISLAGNLMNILLNYVLIFGHWGFGSYGIVGAGYATFIARVFMGGAMFGYVLSTPALRKHISFAIRTLKVKYFKQLNGMSMPMAVQFSIEFSAFIFAYFIVGTMGKDAASAHQIALNVAGISFILVTGIAAATTVRIGYFLGAGEKDDISKAFRVSIMFVLFMMVVAAILMITTREYIPTFYFDASRTDIVLMASSLLVICGFFQIADGVQVICMGGLRGLGDVKVPMWLSVCSYWVVSLPFGILCAYTFDLGVIGIWYGFLAGLTVSAVLQYSRFRYKLKQL
jgi:MATE family multidrug resistance protein